MNPSVAKAVASAHAGHGVSPATRAPQFGQVRDGSIFKPFGKVAGKIWTDLTGNRSRLDQANEIADEEKIAKTSAFRLNVAEHIIPGLFMRASLAAEPGIDRLPVSLGEPFQRPARDGW